MRVGWIGVASLALACAGQPLRRDPHAKPETSAIEAKSESTSAPGELPRDAEASNSVEVRESGPSDENEEAALPIEVKLVQPGSPPRHLLRHSFSAGDEQVLLIRLRATITGLPGNLDAPGLEVAVPLRSRVDSVFPNGSAHFAFELGPMQPGASLGDPGAGVAGTQRMRGSGVVTDRGIVERQKVDSAPDEMAGVPPISLAESSDPLPEEAVGVGAVWKVTRQLSDEGVLVEQVSEYTVKSIAGPRILTLVRRAQRPIDDGRPKPLNEEPSPSGPAKLSRGELTIVLGRVFPEGTLEMNEKVSLGPGVGTADVKAQVQFVPQN